MRFGDILQVIVLLLVLCGIFTIVYLASDQAWAILHKLSS